MVKLLKFALIIMLISSCDFPGSEMGPCVHLYEEPILTIQSVNSAETGNGISTIEIFDVKIDSVSANLAFLRDVLSKNITLQDSVLLCSIPCGFGTDFGTYEFAVRADGFKDSVITKSATYNKNVGGCPSRSSDGTKLSLSLNTATKK